MSSGHPDPSIEYPPSHFQSLFLNNIFKKMVEYSPAMIKIKAIQISPGLYIFYKFRLYLPEGSG